MARIRTVKPEFWDDDIVGTVSRDARLLFVASWNFADDEGLIRWTPDYLKPTVFKYDTDIAVDDVAAWMRELEDAGFVYVYATSRARGRLAFIVNFRKHQRIDKPQGAKLPVPNWRDPAVAMVYARRDEFVCRHCKELVNEQFASLPEWRRFDPVCELIKPRSEGGNDDPTNIGVVHVMCAKEFDPGPGSPPSGKGSPQSFQDDSRNGPGTVLDRSSDHFEGSQEAPWSAPDDDFAPDVDSGFSAGQTHSENVPGTFAVGREGKGRDRKGKEQPPTAPPRTEAPAEAETAPRKRGATGERGTRIPEDFRITPAMDAWGQEHCPHIADPAAATAEFVDYWLGVPGAKGRKADWVSTWRNRMRALEARAVNHGAALAPPGAADEPRVGNNVVAIRSGIPTPRPSTTDRAVASGDAALAEFRRMTGRPA